MTDIQANKAQTYPDRYDDWRLFEGVRTRRCVAFVIDYTMVLLLVVLAVPLIFMAGFATFGAAWLLFLVPFPLVALGYVAWTMGSPSQATWGMRMAGVRLERFDGGRVDSLLAVVHAVLFWASAVIFLPLLLAPLFLDHKRTLHDLLLGTVVVRSDR